ncbi:MAG: DUF1553 domain-containing protein, partial [Verrucomicrobia bacterium]|nr:DUF1553 domain-containing protein [Verrucomicrobiota bacterium]
RRDRTNTPLQALALMNDPMFHEAAEGLARLTGAVVGQDPLGSLFRRVLTRTPSEDEKKEYRAYYETQRARLASGGLKAGAILSAEKGPVTPELAAWAMVARVLLNLNENITRG